MIPNVPEVLRTARKRAGLTSEQAGLAAGVHRTTISGWENGHSVPDTVELLSLFDLYASTGNVQMSDLLESIANAVTHGDTLTGCADLVAA